MRDRQPTKPGRVRLTPENGTAPFYAVMEMADEPTDLGTPPTKENLLTDATEAALFGAAADRTVNEALAGIAGELQKLGTRAQIATGTYAGTDTHLDKTFNLGFRPKFFVIALQNSTSRDYNSISQGSTSYRGMLIWIQDAAKIYAMDYMNYTSGFTFTPTDTGITVVGSVNTGNSATYYNFNYSSNTYTYFAMG